MKEGFDSQNLAAHPDIKSAFRDAGLSDMTIALFQASRLGARRLLANHAAGPSDLKTRFKEDGTPVTIADEQSEMLISAYLSRAFPSARFFGEEGGWKGNPDSSITIYADPLDGTGVYTREGRTSTVGIAVRSNDETTMAVACNPFDRVALVAEKDKGTWLMPLSSGLEVEGNLSKLQVSKVRRLSQRALIEIDGNFFTKNGLRKLQALQALYEAADLHYDPEHKVNEHFIVGSPWSNIYQQLLVASGKADGNLTDCVGIPPDVIVGDLLIREAGGMATDMSGRPINDKTVAAVFSNGHLQDELLQAVEKAYDGYEGFQ